MKAVGGIQFTTDAQKNISFSVESQSLGQWWRFYAIFGGWFAGITGGAFGTLQMVGLRAL